MPNAIGYYVTRIPDDGSASTLLPEVTPGTHTSVVDAGLDPTQAYSWTVVAVYSVPLGGGSGGSGGGSGGGGSGGGGSGGGGSDGGSGDGSGGSSTGDGTGAAAPPSDDYTGNIDAFNITMTGDSAALGWTYKGTANFEIEAEDTSVPGTNFSYVAGTGARSYTFGLLPGDDYEFRIRADRSDGTVSSYAGSSADAPATDPGTPPDGPAYTLSAPTVSDVTQTGTGTGADGAPIWLGTATVTAPANEDDSDGSDSYGLGWDDLGRPDDKYHLDDDSNINVGFAGYEIPDDGVPLTDQPVDIYGSTGTTYTFATHIQDTDTGGFSPESAPFTVTMPGTQAPAMDLQTGQPDAQGNPTVTWSVPDGVTSGGVDFYYVSRQNGQDVPVLYNYSPIDITSGTYTLNGGGLPAGTFTVFAVYNGQGEGMNGPINGWSPYSNQVTLALSGAPAAPASITATAVLQSDGSDDVAVHWQNSPGNETGYELSRSVDGGAFTQIEKLGADETSYTDSDIPYDSDGDADLVYQVVAVGASLPPPPSMTSAADPPTSTPTSRPATSQPVDISKVTIKNVKWRLGDPATPANPGWVAFYGHNFQNYLSVTGTNLQDVQFRQFFTAATTVTDFTGKEIVMQPGNQMANTGPNWVPDGQLNHATGKVNPAPSQGLSVLDASNTIATTAEDTHAGGWTGPSVSNGIKYCEEEIVKVDFKDVFTVIDPNKRGPDKHKVIYTFYWGYTWSNYSYQMTAAQGAPAGVVVCASSSMPGAGLGMLTGYGDGVDFSNVTLK